MGTVYYEVEELVKMAKERGVRVTTRQIGEWHRQGLLPPPAPQARGKPGRPRLRFADPTPDVAVWLGRYRRTVGSAERARLWLWLEGYDYVGVDPQQLERSLQMGVQTIWSALCTALPGLPPLDAGPPNDDQREVIRDLVDPFVSSPLIEAGRLTGVTEATAATRAVLGDADDTADDDMFSYVRRMLRADDHEGHLPEITAVDLPQGANVPMAQQLLDSLSLQRLAQRPIDVHRVRLLWRGLGAVIEMAGMQSDIPPTISPLIDVMRTLHRRTYAQNPLVVIVGIAAVSTMFPADEITRMARHVLVVSRALEDGSVTTSA